MGTRPPLRAALVGCGHISVRHIPAWQATPDAELRHVTQHGTTVLERYGGSSIGDARPMGQGAFNSCIADFAAGVRHDRPFESSVEDNLKTLAITLASYESAARGTAVTPDDGGDRL